MQHEVAVVGVTAAVWVRKGREVWVAKDAAAVAGNHNSPQGVLDLLLDLGSVRNTYEP